MFLITIYFYILMMLLVSSLTEKCIPLFKFQNLNSDYIYFNQLRRLNLITGETTKYEHLKPNISGLCSIDHENNLEGQVIRVGVDNLSPYVMYSRKNKNITGLFGEAWTILEKVLKFKSLYYESTDYSILETGKLDLMLPPTPIEESSVYFTFSTILYQNTYSLFVQSDGVIISKWWYFHIFDEYVWISFIIFVSAITTIMLFINNVEKQLYKHLQNYEDFSGPTYTLLCTLGAITGQGIQRMPSTWSMRLCVLSALHLGMLLSCCFNSTLTSYLALRSHHTKIGSLDDVWKYRTHSVCIRNHTFAERQLKWSIQSNPVSLEAKKKLMQLVNKNCPIMDNEKEVTEHLCKKGFIYVESYDRFLRLYQQMQNKCHIVKIPGYYWSTKVAFLHWTGSKYQKIINTYLIRLRSSGILKYLEEKWTYADKLQESYKEFHPVDVDHIQMSFTGLLAMIFISTIICIIENIWFHLFDKNKVIYLSVRRKDVLRKPIIF